MSADDSNENGRSKEASSNMLDFRLKKGVVLRGGRIFLDGRDMTEPVAKGAAMKILGDSQDLSKAEQMILRRLEEFLSHQNIHNHLEEPPSFSPPAAGERFLYMFLSKKDREHIPGDLAEEAIMLAEKHGAKFARQWYWKQVITSVGPILLAYAQRLVKLGMLAKLFEVVRSIF